MLNPNSRANTVISQSFIASEFQGFNDPFIKSQPTSSLNQFMKSKQTSDSGIFQQQSMEQPTQQSFGFSNITKNQEPKVNESFARKAQENVQNNPVGQPQPMMGYNNQAYQQQQIVRQNQQQYGSQNIPQQQQYGIQNIPQQQYGSPNIPQQQFAPQIIAPQQYGPQIIPQQQNINPSLQQNVNKTVPNQPQFQERYITPQVTKNDSPIKTNPQQFQSQQTKPSVQQPTQPQQNTKSPVDPLSVSRPQQSISSKNLQSSRTQQITQQYSQKQLQGSWASNQQIGQGSTIGKRLKLNVSQEFSNSFVLKCVNQPQKSTILQMKQRQRQYRKSIQNFFK